ncbi:SRPBCC family protein [Amycolatopsis magusensis]|uniref:SRPBCC family protein n=1 Tax=Amycolatopsis magusensis TaxID=882444 RepID=UPI003C307D00
MSEERRLYKEISFEATPEQVWAAISSGPGMSIWFVPHEMGPEGEGEADFGGGNTQAGRVLAREEGRRIVYGDTDSPAALEFVVEGRDNGGTVLRFTQSGFFDGDDWAGEYESFDRGWNLFFHNLAQYFRYFAGLPATTLVTGSTTSLGPDAIWAKLSAALGVDPEVRLGDRVRLTPAGLPPIDGEVDYRVRGVLGVRAAEGLHRFQGFGAEGHGMVNSIHYYYGTAPDRAATTAAWQQWLLAAFPVRF